MLLSATALLASCGGNSSSSSSVSSEASQPVSSVTSSDISSVSSQTTSSSEETKKIVVSGVGRIGVARSTTLVASESGVKWTSSDATIATVTSDGVVTGVTYGTVTITATKLGFEDGKFELTVVAPINDEEELGLFVEYFVSAHGTLAVGADGATYYEYATDTDIDLVPTEVKNIEYSYKYGGMVTRKETLPTLVFGTEYNDVEYRLHLGYGERKNVVLEKAEGDKYVVVDELIPSINEFAGAYNGVEAWSTDPYNVVYLYGSDFDGYTGGFTVNVYHGSDLFATQLVNKSFYVNVEGTYLKAVDTFDLTDSQFFDMPVIATEEGLAYLPETLTEETSLCWYPDFSAVLGDMVDQDGNAFYFDYDLDNGLLDWNTFDEYGYPSLVHDVNGYKVAFTLAGEEPKVTTFTINADYFAMDSGEEGHLLARKGTFFSFGDPDDLADRNLTDGTHTLNLADVFDWETWESNNVFTYDGEVVDGKIVATTGGVAGLHFTTGKEEQTEDHLLLAGDEYLGMMITNGSEVSYWFDADYYAMLYVGDFYTTIDGDTETTVLSISEDYKVSMGEVTVPGKLVYDEEYKAVVVTFGANVFMTLAPEIGLYVLGSGENLAPFLSCSYADMLKGDYYLNGKLTLEYDGKTLTYNGTELPYHIAIYPSGDGTYNLCFVAGTATNQIVLVSLPAGGFMIYEGNNALGVAIESEYWKSVVGTYHYLNEKGEVESLIIGEDGKLQLSTINATGGLDLVEYEYVFTFDESGNLVLNVITDIGVAPFTFSKLGFTIGNITYTSEAYFYAQGTFVNVDKNSVIIIEGDVINLNGMSSDDATFECSSFDGVTVVTITLGNGNVITVTTTPEGKTATSGSGEDTIELKLFEYDLADYVGQWTNGDDVFTLELTDFGYQLKKNGAFYSSTYSVTIQDGHVCITFRAPFGNVSLYIEGGEVKAIFHQSSLPPVPPPPGLGR